MGEWTGWPPQSVFDLWTADNGEECRWDDGDPDLSDLLMLHWTEPSRTVVMELHTSSEQWATRTWDEPTIVRMEENIRHDLEFDGDEVTVTRLAGQGEPCSSSMRWRVVITQD